MLAGDMRGQAPPTPECDKMLAAKAESQSIGEFIEWLGTRGMTICERDSESGNWFFRTRSIEQLLADFFRIDLKKAEQEKMAVLTWIRETQAVPDGS